MICKECKKDKKIIAKGLCQSCYNKQHIPKYPKIKPVKIKYTNCIQCGKEDVRIIKGLCNACYLKDLRMKYKLRPIKRTCIKCGEEKYIVSEGRCSKCTAADRRAAGYKYPKKVEPCKLCGAPSFKLRLCEQHYIQHIESADERALQKRKEYYQKNREEINEKSKAHHRRNKEIYAKRAKEWDSKHLNAEKRKLYARTWYERHKNEEEYKIKQHLYRKDLYQRRKNGNKES